MRLDRRIIAIVAGAVLFGASMAVIKGQQANARGAFGNLSAPWMVVPFLAGLSYGVAWRGALAGLIATGAAFFGFYAAEAFVLDLGAHPWYEDLRLTLGSGHVYEAGGWLTGITFGALGALWSERRSKLAPLAVAAAFILEPLIVWVLDNTGVWGGGSLFDYPALSLTAVALGGTGAALLPPRPPP